MSKFLAELRRRRVLPVAGAYLAAGFLAVEIVNYLLAQAGAPGWTSKLVAIAYVVGFPVAVFLAWVIQIDAQGEHRWDASTSEARTVAAAIVSGVTLTAVLAWLIIPGGDPEPEYEPFPNSLAVLPLATGSGTTNELTIATTLYTVLLDGLDQSPELTQIRLRIDERPDDLVQFGRQFKVATLLLGDVVRSAGATRIEISLLDLAQGEITWSETIEWDPTEIKDIGASIANNVLVATGLQAIEPERISGTTNDDAYLAYVKGIEHQAVFNAAELRKAIEYFEVAIELDPSFVRAHTALASTRDVYAGMSGAQGPDREALTAAAREAAEEAFSLDETSADAISVLARLSDSPLVQQQLLERALELEPDHPMSLHRYALLISRRGGDHEQAERLLRRLLELDPLDANNRSELGFLLWRTGRRDEAMAELEKSIELQPDMPQNYMFLGGQSFLEFGEIDTAIYFLRKAYSLNPEGGFYAMYVANAYADLGFRNEAETWIQRALELGPEVYQVQRHRIVARQRLGDESIAEELSLRFQEKYGDPAGLEAVSLRASQDIRDGRITEGLALFEEGFLEDGGTIAPIDRENWLVGLYYAGLLEDAGSFSAANRLYQDLAGFFGASCAEDREPFCGMSWFLYAKNRDREKTLAALRYRIVNKNSRIDNYQYDDPALDWLRDDPEFVELMDIRNADLEKQRAWVVTRQCAGEMPPAPGIESTIDCS